MDHAGYATTPLLVFRFFCALELSEPVLSQRTRFRRLVDVKDSTVVTTRLFTLRYRTFQLVSIRISPPSSDWSRCCAPPCTRPSTVYLVLKVVFVRISPPSSGSSRCCASPNPQPLTMLFGLFLFVSDRLPLIGQGLGFYRAHGFLPHISTYICSYVAAFF